MAFLPPAPNWYKPFVSAGSDAGFYCFAAKNSVVVLDARRGAPVHKSSWVVGPEVVTCVVFCRSARADADNVPALLTVSSDGKIRVWNVEDRSVKSTAQSQSSTCCADWRGNLSTSVVFSGTNASVLVWSTDTGAAVTVGKAPGQDITILRSHPNDPDIVAVGYNSGTIVVQTLKKGSNLIYKLKGHSAGVLSLSWQVGSSAPNEGSSTEPLCLCSTALDRTLKIWDVTAEKLVKTLRTPTSSKYRKGDTREKWTAASWIPGRSGAIVSSSIAGDICIYDPDGADEGMFLAVDADSGGHSSTVYNLCIVGGAQEGAPMYAVTTSEDRNIVFWDLAAKKSAYCIPCLGGFAYSLVFSPIACATLAIASGDGSVKVWRTDCVKNPYSSKVITLGRKDRVLNVAWHPKKENLLALGTSEGKVCVVDINTRHITVSQSHHTSATYVVCWADLVVEGGSLKTFLLSCGSNRVKIHEFPKLDKDAPDIESLLSNPGPSRAKRTSLAFNRDLGILTLSNMDGLVELYKVGKSPTLEKIATLEVQRKPAECLAWHPSQAPFSDCNSPLMYWLACSSTDGKIFVYDLSQLATPSPEVHRILQPTLQLSGHNAKVVSLAWSPFQETLLASASYDRTVQVWDVEKAQLVATYQGHSSRVFSVCWSPADPDVLFSGGEDNVIRSWKLSEQPVKPVRPPKPPEKAEKQEEAEAAAPLVNGKGIADEITPPKKDTVDPDNQSTGSGPATTSSKTSTSGSKKKAKKMASYFPYSSHFDNLPKESRSNDVQYLADLLAKSQPGAAELDPEHSHLGAYTDRPGAMGVLDAEIAHHKKEHNLDYAFQMMAWKGDLAGALKEAAAERRLTDTLVALAPMVSRFVWIEMCEQYAIQLASEGEHHRAALYFLACRKSEEAVKLLCSNNFHREAVAIARAHFSGNSPEIVEVYESWAERAAKVGNFEQAAKCYLAIGDAAKAVAFLLNRRDPHSLRSAAYVAKRNGLSAEAEMAFQAAFQSSLIHNQWEEAAQFVEEHEKSPVFLSFIKLHKALVEAVNTIGQMKVDTVDGQDSTDRILWSSQDSIAATFLSSLVEAYESHGYSPLKSTEGLVELSGLLGLEKSVLKEVVVNETKEHILFHVAGFLGVALFSPDRWKLYLARALATAKAHNHPLYGTLCQLFFCAKVVDSTFADGAAVSVEPDQCLLLDKLDGASVAAAPTFECPASSASLWSNFCTLTGKASTHHSDPAQEALLLYLCDAILCNCVQVLESANVRASVARELSALALSPTVACLEHLSYRYLVAERNLLTWITEAPSKKVKEPGTAEDEASPQSVLENEVQACKQLLQEMKAATLDCPFPDQTSVLRRLIQLLGDVSDKSYVGLKTTLEAWMQLVLDV